MQDRSGIDRAEEFWRERQLEGARDLLEMAMKLEAPKKVIDALCPWIAELENRRSNASR